MKGLLTLLEIKGNVVHVGLSLQLELLNLVTRSHMGLSIAYRCSNYWIAAITVGVEAAVAGIKTVHRTM